MGYFASVRAAFNKQINYQGKLTDSSNQAVADGDYNMRFKLWTDPSSTSSEYLLWTENCTSTDAVAVTSGLFSHLLGSISNLDAIDFNQTLYLGVEIGATGTPAWDGEMTPRKKLGAVPAAFETDKIDGIDSTSFLRSDQPDTMVSSSASTLLTIQQNGNGNIIDVKDENYTVFSVVDGGAVAVVATSTVAFNVGNGTSNVLTIDTSNQNLLFSGSGSVGISTTSPLAKLDIFGSMILSGSSAGRYINFGNTAGTNGYGFYDSSGTIQFKNSGGTWSAIQAYDAELGEIAALADTKGNLIAGNGSSWAALTVGTDNYVLTASSTATSGVAWQPAGSYLAIDNLSDVVVTSAAAGDLILYNGTSWVDFATSSLTVDLTKASGTLPLSKGGTNKSASASAGAVAYSDSDSYEFTTVGTAGQLLMSNNTSAPSWISTSSLAIDLHQMIWTNVNSTDLKTGSVTQAYDAELGEIAALADTKGNLIAGNGSSWAALTVGTDNYVLTASSTATSGVAWQPASGSSNWGDGGSFLYPGDNSGLEEIIVGGTTTSTAEVMLSYNSNSWFTGGNVGIGTTSPSAKFHVVNGQGVTPSFNNGEDFVVQDNDGSADWAVMDIVGGISGGSSINFGDTISSSAGYIDYDHSSDSLNFSTNGSLSALITIDSQGYLGVGTTSPEYLFSTFGSINDYLGYFYNENASSSAGGIYTRSDGTGNLLTLNYAGSDIVTINQAQSFFSNPVNFAAAGDVSLAYDLIMNNTSAGYVKFQGPGYVQTESSWQNLDLTLSAAGTGVVLVDDTLNVGGNIQPSTDDTYDLGSSSYRWDDVYATNGTIQTSDERLKENIVDLTYGLEEIMELRPVSFTWKENPQKGTKLGLIAQEAVGIVPEAVDKGEDLDYIMGIRYTDLIPVIIKAIQEQQASIEALGGEKKSINEEMSKNLSNGNTSGTGEISSFIGKAIICPMGMFWKEDDCVLDEGNLSNGKSVFVETLAVKDDSVILATPVEVFGGSLAVTEIVAGKGFRVEIANLTEKKIEFNWFVTDKK